jgi:murein DD-endopeptidase MepM/ murein hydrolase activator NlpD
MRKNRLKKKYEMHTGIDLASPRGTLVKAATSGTVISACYNKGYGNCILIDHGNGIQTRYAHLHNMIVKNGQSVQAGQHIGRVGNTGNTRGIRDSSHLHFELIVNKIRYDPLPYLR